MRLATRLAAMPVGIFLYPVREDSRCIAAKDGLRVVCEKDANMSGIENLRYSIDVFDVR
jgi:hypothetical protein